MIDDCTAWAEASKFHAIAVEKLGQMEQEPFWEWIAAKMIDISNANGNGPLIMALLIAIFEDIEAREKILRQNPALVMSA